MEAAREEAGKRVLTLLDTGNGATLHIGIAEEHPLDMGTKEEAELLIIVELTDEGSPA